MSLAIPAREAESLRNTGTSNKLWPVGTWKGTFEDFSVRDLPTSREGVLFKGYTGPTGERLAITIGENQPLDGQDDVGGQKRFVDITLRDGPYSLETTPYADIPETSWQLKASARVLVNLAAALDQIDMVGEGDESQCVVKDGFVDMLRDGAFKGQDIGYVIYHRKGGDGVTRAEIDMFIAA